uniref:SEC7 domain-containing protein n=1 Tax=Macrostomum lignano TaxID=282301 RepID=A0A1I8GJ93_9PLAT
MGQILTRRQYEDLLIDGLAVAAQGSSRTEPTDPELWPDFATYRIAAGTGAGYSEPPGPTDLCLAACVWAIWLMTSCCGRPCAKMPGPIVQLYSVPGRSYRQLYLRLDEASLSFNADCFDGFACFLRHEFLLTSRENWPCSFTALGCWTGARLAASWRLGPDVLDKLMERKSFENQFLPNALRKFFNEVEAPNARNEYLSLLLDRFSLRFVASNPGTGLSKEMVFILCYSLILLSVDLCSPHVKNKMSKREFIRNTRRATTPISDDFLGHLYDNIYLSVAAEAAEARSNQAALRLESAATLSQPVELRPDRQAGVSGTGVNRPPQDSGYASSLYTDSRLIELLPTGDAATPPNTLAVSTPPWTSISESVTDADCNMLSIGSSDGPDCPDCPETNESPE